MAPGVMLVLVDDSVFIGFVDELDLDWFWWLEDDEEDGGLFTFVELVGLELFFSDFIEVDVVPMLELVDEAEEDEWGGKFLSSSISFFFRVFKI